MPIYEYVCQSCQHHFEVKQRFSDAPLTSCARCGQAVTKIISAPAIMFKGSGWYVTDYSDKLKAPEASDAKSKPAESQGDQKSPPAQGGETSVSTAPAASSKTSAESPKVTSPPSSPSRPTSTPTSSSPSKPSND